MRRTWLGAKRRTLTSTTHIPSLNHLSSLRNHPFHNTPNTVCYWFVGLLHHSLLIFFRSEFLRPSMATNQCQKMKMNPSRHLPSSRRTFRLFHTLWSPTGTVECLIGCFHHQTSCNCYRYHSKRSSSKSRMQCTSLHMMVSEGIRQPQLPPGFGRGESMSTGSSPLLMRRFWITSFDKTKLVPIAGSFGSFFRYTTTSWSAATFPRRRVRRWADHALVHNHHAASKTIHYFWLSASEQRIYLLVWCCLSLYAGRHTLWGGRSIDWVEK